MKKNSHFGVVADLYDIYVQWDVDVPMFRAMSAHVKGEVLELMCGTGRLSIPLLQSGVRLCCVDYSAEMLEVLRHKLREHNLSADVQEQDVRNLDLGRSFELILLPFHSFAEILAPEDRALALTRIRMHLAPKGRFVVTLHNPAIQVPRLDGKRRILCENPIPGADATLRVWSTAWFRPERRLGEAIQEYETLDRDGRLLERRELPLQFAVIDHVTFERAAAEAGFQILHLSGDYSGAPFDPDQSPYMVWELGAGQSPAQGAQESV